MEALKNRDNKKVSVRFKFYEQKLIIDIVDNGPGIEEKVLDELFTRGVSTKGDDRGIGLFLVKNSLDRLNGHLDISTTVDKGTRFTLLVPYETKK